MDKLSIRYIKLAAVFIFVLIVLALFAKSQLEVLVEEKEEDIQTQQLMEVIKQQQIQEQQQKLEQERLEQERMEQERLEQQRQEEERIRLEQQRIQEQSQMESID